jgi:hypothetical protein
MDEIMMFPGAAVKVSNTEYLFVKSDEIKQQIAKVTDADSLAAVMSRIVEIRNEMSLSAQLNSVSTGGHGEAGNNALVEECDDRLRRGNPKLRYTSQEIVDAMWALLDYHPKDGATDEQIVATFAQHVYSLGDTYPHLFAEAGDDDLIPGVKCANRRHHFYDELLKTLRKTPKLIFDQQSDSSRVKKLLGFIEEAAVKGVTAIKAIGKSKRYAEFLASK